jgi:hypothetical protein
MLAIVNNVVMSMSVWIALWGADLTSFSYIPWTDIAYHMVVLFLPFWGTSILVFTKTIPICLSTNSAQVFPLFNILANTCCILLFDNNHPDCCEIVIIISICISLMISDAVLFIIYLLPIYMTSLDKFLFKVHSEPFWVQNAAWFKNYK